MLKFILIIILVIVFVAPVRRFIFWLIVGRQLTNIQKKYQEQQQANQEPQRAEGDIKIKSNQSKSKHNDNSEGQYIDYEEVKD